MRMILRWLVILTLIAALSICILGARAGEGAVRPVRVPVPPVCPCVAHVHCRNAETTSPDGTVLKAWYYEPDEPNAGTVLMFHGVGGNRADVVGLAAVYEKAGYTVLTADLRGHGESGGLVTYGAQDERDVQTWVTWLLRQPGNLRIYGYGPSLGGSVLLESLKHETRFRAVIAESAFSDFSAIATERIDRMAPENFKWLAPPFVASGIFWVKLHYGVDLRTASALDGIRATSTPVLLAHGLEDNLTSPENSRRLAAANPDKVQLWLVPKASHANLWATAGKEFETRTLAWWASH